MYVLSKYILSRTLPNPTGFLPFCQQLYTVIGLKCYNKSSKGLVPQSI